MVFNVVAHNRDDHTKQVSLLLQENGEWRLAPAYDLTCSDGPGGEHSMAIAGRGHPDVAAVLEVADAAGIPARTVRRVLDEVNTAVVDGWAEVAPSAATRRRVGKLLHPVR
jgi:serine/threonine-protein kinase HipA